jgi:hypothetical protein
MHRRFLLAFSFFFLVLSAHAAPRLQDTGFLNRSLEINGVLHRYVVYLPRKLEP